MLIAMEIENPKPVVNIMILISQLARLAFEFDTKSINQNVFNGSVQAQQSSLLLIQS